MKKAKRKSPKEEVEQLKDHEISEQDIEKTIEILKSKKFSPRDLIFIKQLGSGSFSKVFKVQDKETNKFYVLKISDKERVKKSSLKQNSLENELKMLQYCASIHGVPKVYQYLEDDNNIMLLEQYLRGENLLDYILTTTLTEFEIFGIFYCLYNILKSVHKLNIIHHDLKPDNIIIDNNNFYKSPSTINSPRAR